MQHLEQEIARLETQLLSHSYTAGSDERLSASQISRTEEDERGNGNRNGNGSVNGNDIANYNIVRDITVVQEDIKGSILASDSLQAMIKATMPSEPRLADLLPRVRMGLTPSFVLSSSARENMTMKNTTSNNVNTLISLNSVDGPDNTTGIHHRTPPQAGRVDFSLLLALPADVVRSLVKKYVNNALPALPILHETTVWEQVDRVLAKVSQMLQPAPGTVTKRMDGTTEDGANGSGDGISNLQEDHDCLVVYLILAISATLGGAAQGRQEARCLAYSAALFNEGLQHLSSRAPFPDDLASLQVTLLILQYAFINPLCANVWVLSGTAMRTCLELGLHRNLSDSQAALGRLDSGLVERRRRVFWVAYVMDRSVCSALQRPVSIPDPAIDAQYPTGSQALQWIEYSRIQSLITEVHFQGMVLKDGQRWENWLAETEQRLHSWFHSFAASASPSIPSSSYDSGEYALTHALMSLHRPSPRVPIPAPSSLLAAFEYASTSARQFQKQLTTGTSRRPWLAAHQTLESALVVLFCLRHNHIGISQRFTAHEILESTKLFTSNLLSITSQGWSAVSRYAGIYERLLGPLLEAVFTSTEPEAFFGPAQDAELLGLLYPGPAHLPSLRSGTKVQANFDTFYFDTDMADFNYAFLEGNGEPLDFIPLPDIPVFTSL